jgi:hypothetical protein
MNKRELVNLVVGVALMVTVCFGLALVINGVQASDVAMRAYQFDFYADHASPQPVLGINHAQGRPGSYFRVWGYGYPAYSQASIVVNGHDLATVQVDSIGYLNFQFSTAGADDGVYSVVVSVNPDAMTQFVLDSASPDTWLPEYGDVVSVPPGIALTEFLNLPIILR